MSATFPLTDGNAARPNPALTPDRRRAFASAERHSRRVRRLRVALPLASLMLASLVGAYGVLSKIRISLAVGDLAITAEGLAMDAPRLSGSDGKGRTYEVVAGRAVQDLSDPKIIRLESITAHVKQADGSEADFKAATGVYDARAQTLVLDRSISIRGSDGSAADLQRAEIDLATGEVSSDAPVSFSSSLGSVQARGMEVGDKAKSVTFGGGVKMTIDPNAIGNAGTDGLPGLSNNSKKD